MKKQKRLEFNLDALDAMQTVSLGTNHVARWQGTPKLLPYNVSTHAFNCAQLYLQLSWTLGNCPDIRMVTCLLNHDNMEALTGDVLAPAKNLKPKLWDAIEDDVQSVYTKKNGINIFLSVPVERDFHDVLDEDEYLLMKVIDMLEFLLHAQQEHTAGNRDKRVLASLIYGVGILRSEVASLEKTAFNEYARLVRYYYNRKCTDTELTTDYYV